MTYALNMLGMLLNALSCIQLAMIIGYLLSKDGMAHRRYLWLGLAYSTLQGFTSATVWLNLYIGHFEMLTAILRLAFGVMGQVLIITLGANIYSLIRALRKVRDEEVKAQDDRDNLMMAVEGINQVFDTANHSQKEHVRRQQAILVSLQRQESH